MSYRAKATEQAFVCGCSKRKEHEITHRRCTFRLIAVCCCYVSYAVMLLCLEVKVKYERLEVASDAEWRGQGSSRALDRFMECILLCDSWWLVLTSCVSCFYSQVSLYRLDGKHVSRHVSVSVRRIHGMRRVELVWETVDPCMCHLCLGSPIVIHVGCRWVMGDSSYAVATGGDAAAGWTIAPQVDLWRKLTYCHICIFPTLVNLIWET